ncbi:unnamed protein product [Notodromas monacha]|uniref:Uncharacterized protein n=1 Tax=Notodromas monacha TaxID=399045 RepID=A0A7R9C387_9CRUS|nr:unnamed protein product [Notodromas monacha]CAG0926109.1 unnamed protein product [Notodromas monacha]
MCTTSSPSSVRHISGARICVSAPSNSSELRTPTTASGSSASRTSDSRSCLPPEL